MTDNKPEQPAAETPEKLSGLQLLRSPFPAHLIGKLPKPTKMQNDAPANAKRFCNVCKQKHVDGVFHVDYVGHAALTDRLLDCDESWDWSPLAVDQCGLPLFDQTGGLWITLTVCGITRKGYGNAGAPRSWDDAGKREKEVIGDALRNAAMRFGAALDLWHKGDLHADEAATEDEKTAEELEDLLTPTTNDLQWVSLVEKNHHVLKQINDPVYRARIERLVKRRENQEFDNA